MKFKRLTSLDLGEERIITKFAIIPITLYDGSETRWFEKIKVKQRWSWHNNLAAGGFYYWKNIEFIDD